ncbi:MAG: hypothetical protein ACI9KM_001169 [Rubritalea sp.]|jgi:hypothetical protein
MARELKTSAASAPEHIIQRGNIRHVVFTSEEDMMAYVTWLKDYAKKYNVATKFVGIHQICPQFQYSVTQRQNPSRFSCNQQRLRLALRCVNALTRPD